MKKITYLSIVAMLMVSLNSCDVLKTKEVVDPNFPSVDAVLTNASKGQLDALAIGQISIARDGLATYLQVVGTIGKELFNFNSTESRWMTELNGVKPIDNSAFYNGATTTFGLPVRHANIINASLAATSSVTEVEKNGYKGLANTFKGLAMLYQLNVQYNNGIRLNVEDPFKPSKAASYAESLAGIAAVLDQASTQLDGAGAAFPFALPSGYAGFNTPANFKKFNRAIALRVALYQKDWTKAATLLGQTFYSATGDLNAGPKHTFSATPPDRANPMLNTSTVRIVAVQKIMDDAEAGDKRLSKVAVVAPALTFSSGVNYSSKYLTNMYLNASDVVPVIRNEELVLIGAEIAANQNNVAEATRLINIVRAAAGLKAYTGATTQAALINAILKERLYSLFYEGHRWVDMRRNGKLSEIVLPVSSMKVLEQLERPVAEVNWDKANP